jgi:5-formyltetrahydrofolate cyclo-ligase
MLYIMKAPVKDEIHTGEAGNVISLKKRSGRRDTVDKKEIRKRMLQLRDEQKPADRALWDDIIFSKLTGGSDYRNAATIFIFVSFRSEVDTHRIIRKALEDGKVVAVPKVLSRAEGMRAFRIESMEDLQEGYFGVLEPREGCPEIPVGDIELILMPGAAFDREGGRIGYGGGFYDRYISEAGKDLRKVALAYRMQVLDRVPMEENDIRVDAIITN